MAQLKAGTTIGGYLVLTKGNILDVLSKLAGPDSGLDADTVDGKHASDFSLSGHTHNYAGSSSVGGAATSAVKLTTARTINGTSFDGSANITTVNWGTARTLTIGSTGKSVNGSGNVSWTLAEIGAAAASHTHNYAGSSSAGGAATTALACTGNSATATTLQTARTINGTSFDGSANITTANWGTTRTITIGSTGKLVNGSGNISWSLSEIGAAAASHTHNYAGSSSAGGAATTALACTGNSATATKLATARTIFGKSFDGTGNIAGKALIYGTYTETASSRYTNGALEIRENGLVGSTQSDIGYAPQLSFHWSGRIAATLAMSSGGEFQFINQAGTGYSNVRAGTFVGSLSGNASTASTLATARTINGTSFNGSANITTANWGTARTITIGSTGKSVNGSGNVSWSLSEIGAAATSHTHTTVGSYIGISNTTGTNGYGLSLYGGATAGAPAYGIMFQQTGTFGTHGSVTSDWATYFTMTGSTSRGWIFKAGNASGGNIASISATGVITASSFVGSLSGNASTASTLATARTINGTSFNGSANITTANWGTARTITIGSTGKSVNGSGNVSWSLAEIGAAAASHSHSYLPLSGGTLTGRLTANGKITIPTTGSSWITGKTLTNASIAISTKQTTGSYHPILAVQSSSGHVINFGGLGDNTGFYGYQSTRTDNGTDWSFVFNVGTGAVSATGSITAQTFYSNNWFRAKGTNGFYFEDWGGGWHMEDSTWIRSYKGKNIYTSGALLADSYVQTGYVMTTSNGQGTNLKIGDDCWLGDCNESNTFRVGGEQDWNRGFIRFGAGGKIGYNGGTSIDIVGDTWIDGYLDFNSVAQLCPHSQPGTLYIKDSQGTGFGGLKLGNGGCRIYGSANAERLYIEGGIYTNKTIECGAGMIANGAVIPGGNAIGGWDLGGSTRRWYTLYAVNTNLSSDKSMKEDIQYVNKTALYNRRDTTTPFKDFLINDLKIATYKYKRTLVEKNELGVEIIKTIAHVEEDSQIGFIAQDIRNSDIGSLFVYGEEGNMSYSPTGFTAVIAQALQEEIESRDLQNEQLKDELNYLKEENNSLKERLAEIEQILGIN